MLTHIVHISSSSTLLSRAFIFCCLSALAFSGCDAEDDPTLTGGGVTAGMNGSGGAQVSGEQVGGGEQGGEQQGGEPLPTTPIEGCVGPAEVEDLEENRPADPQECVTCEGAPAPNFALRDLSPTSCGVSKYYGLDAFQGEVTFVVLLRSTCGYCHAQLERLEMMRFELLALGHTLNMVVINEINTEATVNLLTQRSQISVLQDVPEVNAWGALSDLEVDEESGEETRKGGDKDDMYIYSADGTLWRFLDDDDPTHKLNLSTDEGYAYLKAQLLEALGAE